MKKIIRIGVVVIATLLFSGSYFVFAEESTPTPSTEVTPTGSASSEGDKSKKLQELNDKIAELEGKLAETRSQKNSLSAQIETMDNQIKLTEFRVNATQQEITDITLDIDSAGKRMDNLEKSLSDVSKTLLNRVVATYQAGGAPQLQALLASDDLSEFLARENYLKVVQDHDKQLLYNAQQAKNDYANQKQIFESKKQKIESLKKQLEEYTSQLDTDKIEKERLLTLTKNDEAKYQRMIEEARKQISSFKSFAAAQGGSILPPQASPDGWYYNQRDERWGGNRIGTSSESMWQVGCLVTSTAMLRKQRGENVTPADVARESNYFFADTAMMLIPWNGGKFSTANTSGIDSKLASGQPVIVGLYAGAYGTHFIVLKSGSGGSYTMNDPWNGPDLNFSDYYSPSQIFQFGYLN